MPMNALPNRTYAATETASILLEALCVDVKMDIQSSLKSVLTAPMMTNAILEFTTATSLQIALINP